MSTNVQKRADFDRLVAYERGGTLSSLIIETSDLAVKAETLDGVITSWNHGAETIYGYKDSEIVGRNISLIVGREHRDEMNQLMKKIGSGEIVPRYETKRVRKDGVIIEVWLSLSPIKNEKGEIIGIATLSRDITASNAASNRLAFRDQEEGNRAAQLLAANKELAFQSEEKEKRAVELAVANKELAFQDKEKERRADELIIANKELVFQNNEKEKRAHELIIANKELEFQNGEKEKRAEELGVANKELEFQNEEKGKRADELLIANKELIFQNEEKEKRAAELVIADIELDFQKKQKEKREIANRELEAVSNAAKQASQYARSLIEAATDPLVTISLEGKITDVNEASVNVTGVAREKLIGTDFSDYFTEPEKAREGYKQGFERGSVSNYPLTIHHKNGRLTEVLYNASVYRDDKGTVLGVFAAARDITAQKRLERDVVEREKELERLVELERFRKLTVGRELKMMELKKENEELRAKLGALNDDNN
ncbi:hypothetical protein BH09BAC3_BH09BAC3_29230 [soil metagenome]